MFLGISLIDNVLHYNILIEKWNYFILFQTWLKFEYSYFFVVRKFVSGFAVKSVFESISASLSLMKLLLVLHLLCPRKTDFPCNNFSRRGEINRPTVKNGKIHTYNERTREVYLTKDTISIYLLVMIVTFYITPTMSVWVSKESLFG